MTRLFLLLCLLAGPAMACNSVNGLPDPACSPGAVDPAVTQENIHQTICMRGYAKSVRPPLSVSSRLKRQVMRAYGVTGSMRDYEADHIVSLELGGAPDDPANIFPQPWDGPWGARDKDRIENRLHRMVCRGEMPLAEAQRRIAQDWRHALDDRSEVP
jgi:hypothetical protein